jgi:hypothetical protein
MKGTAEKCAYFPLAASERDSAELQLFCEYAAAMRQWTGRPRSDFYSPFSISL